MGDAKVVLITGATGGIGRALAACYAAQPDTRLVLVARRPLAALADPLFTPERYCQADLAEPERAAQRIAEWLAERGITRLDRLICNAGVGYHGGLAAQSAASVRELIEVNLLAPMALTHRLYPLVRRVGGALVFVSSVAATLPTPRYAVYSASKAALDEFARTVRIEQGGRVIVLHPGATNTGMHAKSGITRAEMDWERFAAPERVATLMVAAIEGGRDEATIGWGNRIVRAGSRLAGGWLDRGMRWQAARRAEGGAAPASPRHIVITGAADGIGRALALRWAAAGWQVTGIDVDAVRARETEAALRAAGNRAPFIVADLATEAGQRHIIEALREGPPIGWVAHNAGINAVGRFVTSDFAAQRAVIELNLLAPLLLTRELLAASLLPPGGGLLFVASLSVLVSYPGAAGYAAAKAGLASYARSVGVALAEQGIHVLTLFPGPTRTAHARRYSPDNRREHRRMAPARLAALAWQAAAHRQPTLIPGWGNRALALLGHIAPALMAQLMRRAMMGDQSADDRS